MEKQKNQRSSPIAVIVLLILAAAMVSGFWFHEKHLQEERLHEKQQKLYTALLEGAEKSILEENYDAAVEYLDSAIALDVDNRKACMQKLDILLLHQELDQAQALAASAGIQEAEAYLDLLKEQKLLKTGFCGTNQIQPGILKLRFLDLEEDGIGELLVCTLEKSSAALQVYEYKNSTAVQKENGSLTFPVQTQTAQTGENRYDFFLTEYDSVLYIGMSSWEDPLKYTRLKRQDEENDAVIIVNCQYEEIELSSETYNGRKHSSAVLYALTEAGFETVVESDTDSAEKIHTIQQKLREFGLEAEADAFSARNPYFHIGERTQQLLFRLRVVPEGMHLILDWQEPENTMEQYQELMAQYYRASIWGSAQVMPIPPGQWQGNLLELEHANYSSAGLDINQDGIDEYCVYKDDVLYHLWAYNGYDYTLAYSQDDGEAILYENALKVGQKVYVLTRRGILAEVT